MACAALMAACSRGPSQQEEAEKRVRLCQFSLELGTIEEAGDVTVSEHQDPEEAEWDAPFDGYWQITSWYEDRNGERTWYECTVDGSDVHTWFEVDSPA